MTDETPPIDQEPLKTLVKNRRLALGMTQEDLADRMSMSQRWVSNLETDGITAPRLPVMQKLAAVLRLPVEDLYIAAGMASSKSGAQRLDASSSSTKGTAIARGYEGTTDAEQDPDAPLTPEDMELLGRMVFSGLNGLSNAQIREILDIIRKG